MIRPKIYHHSTLAEAERKYIIAHDADIWRVFLQYSQNIEGVQIIYINDDGITVMIVTT